MFYMEEPESNNYKGVTGTRGKFGYDLATNYSGYTDSAIEGKVIFSPVSTEESDYKGCDKYCKGLLGHGRGFLFMGGGGKAARDASRECRRNCKAAGGAAALQDKETTEDMLNKLQGDDGGTSPIVWVMAVVILLALAAGGYMLFKKKK